MKYLNINILNRLASNIKISQSALRHFLQACIKYLLMSESRGDMCDKFQKEFEGIWPRDFVNYFKERVLPKANRLGKWALGEVNIYDESFFNHAGGDI